MADKPPLPPRFGDPRKHDEKRHICRQFLWGKCTKFGECRYRHELDIKEMQKALKFCRNFQNRVGCDGIDCTYLHTSKEEQKLFFESGVLPKVLKERHAAIAALAFNTNMTIFNNSAAVQQLNTGFQHPTKELSPDTIAMPPPPPPLPVPPPPPAQQPREQSAKVIAQTPPPPPPPITQYQVPSTAHSTQPSNVSKTFTVHTAQQQQQQQLQQHQQQQQQPQQQQQQPQQQQQVSNHKPDVPADFDLSCPPPAAAQQFSPATGSKRKWPDVQIDGMLKLKPCLPTLY